MRRDNSDFKTNFISEAGTFANNKDYFAFIEFDDFACWVVANGIDSEEDIKSAEIAVKSIFADFSEMPTLSRRKIKKYILNAHKILEEESKNVRLKTSFMMVVTNYAKIVWAGAGNARLYHFRKGRFHFKSKDQSLAQMMAEAGQIDEYAIDTHEEKNNLTNYLGKPEAFKPFISKPFKLSDGDVIFLSTIGFWEKINSLEIAKGLKDAKEPFELLDYLEELFLGRQNKIVKNYTMAAIFANKVFKEAKKDHKGLFKKVAKVMLPILVISGGIGIYKIKDAKKMAQFRSEMIKHEKLADEFAKDGMYEEALKEYKDAQGSLKKIKIKNKGKEAALDKKCKITQFILEGDKNLESNDYEKAIKSYEKAKKYAEKEESYDLKELEAKIAKAQSCMQVLNMMETGDTLFENKNYTAAKDTYMKAKRLADKASFEEGKKELKGKMEEVDAQMQSLDKAEKDVESNQLEKLGDERYQTQEYEKAIQFYVMAQEVYQELNDLQGVLALQKKIDNAQAKLTSPIENEKDNTKIEQANENGA